MALLQVAGIESEGKFLYRIQELLHLVVLRVSIHVLEVQQPHPTRIPVDTMAGPTLPGKLEAEAFGQPAHLFKA
jgi:hypothetical protein